MVKKRHGCLFLGNLFYLAFSSYQNAVYNLTKKVFFSTKDHFGFRFRQANHSADENRPVISSGAEGLPNSVTSGRRNLRHT